METMDKFKGRVFQINLSQGGVPKGGVPKAEVTHSGLVGDRQIHLRVHGGPDRAVCLYALEPILALQAEGHPIFPGAMGENLTLADLDWACVAPGDRLKLGQGVVLEVTKYTSPCDALVDFFKEGDFSRVSQKTHPGWARVYARVLQEGTVQVGDAVVREEALA